MSRLGALLPVFGGADREDRGPYRAEWGGQIHRAEGGVRSDSGLEGRDLLRRHPDQWLNAFAERGAGHGLRAAGKSGF